MNEQNAMTVYCSVCGKPRVIARGHLTQEGISNYRCDACSEPVLENGVQEKQRADRKLLLED